MKTILLASTICFALAGCANMTPNEQAALDDLGAVAEGVAIVGAVILDTADEPPIRTEQHREWCENHESANCSEQFEVRHK